MAHCASHVAGTCSYPGQTAADGVKSSSEEQALTTRALPAPFFPWLRGPVASSTALRRRTAKNSIESVDASEPLRSCAPTISMMKATEPGTGDHRRRRRRLAFHWPSIRRVLIEGIVNPVVVIVADVIANEPPEMLFV